MGLQPVAAGALLAIGWPSLSAKRIVADDVVRFDTERILEDLGGAVAVVTGDRFGGPLA